MEFPKRGIELVSETVERARVFDLGAPDALLQLRLLFRQRLVELLQPVEGGFKRADVGFRIEGIWAGPGATAGRYTALGEPLNKVFDNEVFALYSSALAFPQASRKIEGQEITENSSREKLLALGKIGRDDSVPFTMMM